MLYSNEARLNKNGKLSYGSEETRKVYTILNPLKGSYKELEDKLKKLLEVNNTSILKVKFSNGDTLYLSCTSLEDLDIVVYDSLEDAIGRKTDTCNVAVGNARKWDDSMDKYTNMDISVCGAIRKGL